MVSVKLAYDWIIFELFSKFKGTLMQIWKSPYMFVFK